MQPKSHARDELEGKYGTSQLGIDRVRDNFLAVWIVYAFDAPTKAVNIS